MKWFALLAAVLGWCAHAHDARARNDAPRPKTEECNRVVFAIFDLIDVEFSKSEPNYPDIKAALKGAPSQLSCEFSALADVAKRRKYFHKIVTTPVFLADGKERLPRIYSISFLKGRALASILFTSDGEFLPERSFSFRRPYSDDPGPPMDVTTCKRLFDELLSHVDRRLNEQTSDWYRVSDELRNRVPLNNCPIPDLNAISRRSQYLRKIDQGSSDRIDGKKVHVFWFSNDILEIDIRFVEDRDGQARLAQGAISAKPAHH